MRHFHAEFAPDTSQRMAIEIIPHSIAHIPPFTKFSWHLFLFCSPLHSSSVPRTTIIHTTNKLLSNT